MKINFERSGGFTAIPLRWNGDSSQLEKSQENSLLELIEKTEFFNLPNQIQAKSSTPDRFSYKLTIEDNNRSHTITAAESALPAPLQTLISQLTSIARNNRTG
jgi:hypothetical protein